MHWNPKGDSPKIEQNGSLVSAHQGSITMVVGMIILIGKS